MENFRFPPSPGMPLFPVSPERLNIATYYELPDSPTRSPRHDRNISDVHGMVARFNSLDIKDHAELRKKDEAALRRAQMGREEAEEELRNTREQSQRLEKELEEVKEREKKVVKKLNVVMEDLHRTKEGQSHSQALYEKEIRRARKEAFKSSSVLVKLQEELKATRSALREAHSDRDLEKIKVGKRDQEVFKAQYQLVGTQEELAQTQAKIKDAQARIKVVEEERDALKQNLKEEEVARIAAEGRIALPISQKDDDHELNSLTKQNRQTESPVFKYLEFDFLPSVSAMEEIREQLDLLSQKAASAEAQVDFMKMECQLGCCTCKLAAEQELIYVHDDAMDFQLLRPSNPTYDDIVVETITQEYTLDVIQFDISGPEQVTPPQSSGRNPVKVEEVKPNSVWSVSPHTKITPTSKQTPQTTHIASACNVATEPEEIKDEEDLLSTQAPCFNNDPGQVTIDIDVIDDIELPRTPVRAFTTVTRVPLKDDNNATQDYSAFQSPAHLTREEAMEQIRQRRGRARSIAGTPKRLLSADQTPRRDISAPEMGTVKIPGPAARSQSRMQ